MREERTGLSTSTMTYLFAVILFAVLSALYIILYRHMALELELHLSIHGVSIREKIKFTVKRIGGGGGWRRVMEDLLLYKTMHTV